MPKKIDHEERKEHILKSALEVFADVGYRDANLSLIAERSGISRPTLYLYFKGKEEIYYYAVKQVTGRLFTELSGIAFNEENGDEVDRIVQICKHIISRAKEIEPELTRLLEVMLQEKNYNNRDFTEVIYHRTIKLSILFKRLLSYGVKKGHLIELDVDKVSSHIFTLLEAFCFQIAFFRSFDEDESVGFVRSYLDFFRVRD